MQHNNGITVEDWYSHQISNLLQKNNKNKTERPLWDTKYKHTREIINRTKQI